MNIVGEFKSTQINDFDILELPYAGDDLSMLIAVPPDDMAETEILNLFEIFEQLSNKTQETEIILPRFEASFDCNVISISLKKIEIETLFDEPLILTQVNKSCQN